MAQATRQRAAVYAHLFKVLKGRLGEQQAIDLMSEAIYNYGKDKSGSEFSAEARGGDLREAAAEFASPDPVKQHQFAPRIVAESDEEVLIAMSGCPLVDEWRGMGLPQDEIATLCRISRAVDHGTWEGALGCELCFEGTRGEGQGECVLRVRKKSGGAAG
ncbi:MAG TPA: L-2-amino-thiazoline-4-carboxylic acid hydrolase [Candidatus Deferrimicrobiaceae bacterium]